MDTKLESPMERTTKTLNNSINKTNIPQLKVEEDSCSNDYRGAHSLGEYTISDRAKVKIKAILDQIRPLPKIDKFLIYLKLSDEISNCTDPLRQPLNPLGSRSEISATICWIRTHLEEDSEISLPKQQVYDEYFTYCNKIQIKPLSQADFGKVMKQVYPKVKARRLGTRGNSRYCYSGLRNCLKLKPPFVPDLGAKTPKNEKETNLLTAAWIIVKTWSEKQLGHSFLSIQALAFFLVIHCSVGINSEAAKQLTSAAEPPKFFDTDDELLKNDHKIIQSQLQKKLQSKTEPGKERKRKLQNIKPLDLVTSTSKKIKPLSKTIVKDTSPVTTQIGKKSPKLGKMICDTKSQEFIQPSALPDFDTFHKISAETTNKTTKVAIPRLLGQTPPLNLKSVSSPSKYKTIQPKANHLQQQCDILSYNAAELAGNRSQNIQDIDRLKDSVDDFDSELPLSRERLNSISNVGKDAMDEYLGKNNSQHEEELSKYFNNNNSAEIDTSTKLSQLRHLLEQNGIAEPRTTINEPLDTPITTIPSTDLSFATKYPINFDLKNNIINNTINVKRRVSFETRIKEESVPPSPNTQRKHFSFTPINSGPTSPNTTKSNSTNASPFISPRSTPVGRNKAQNIGKKRNLSTSTVTSTKTIKEEPELLLDVSLDNGYATMSAPVSPMLTSNKSFLQTLLNSSQKVPYNPNYAVASPCEKTVDLGDINLYRSQSVPLFHMMGKSAEQVESYALQNGFSDLDDAIVVEPDATILTTLDATPFNLIPENGGPYSGAELSPKDVSLAEVVPKIFNRSQSCADVFSNSIIPSVFNKNSDDLQPIISRSYPSTPLLGDDTGFNYNLSGDFLLNGQAVKNELSQNLSEYYLHFNELPIDSGEGVVPFVGDAIIGDSILRENILDDNN